MVTGIQGPLLAFYRKDGAPGGELATGAELIAAPPYAFESARALGPMIVVVTRNLKAGATVRAVSRSIEPAPVPLGVLPGLVPVPAASRPCRVRRDPARDRPTRRSRRSSQPGADSARSTARSEAEFGTYFVACAVSFFHAGLSNRPLARTPFRSATRPPAPRAGDRGSHRRRALSARCTRTPDRAGQRRQLQGEHGETDQRHERDEPDT